ncbi:MAG TPA: SelB C-terminal domain-containing protein, partial [Tepidiformaceae bacterium]
ARVRGLQRHRSKVDRLDPGTRAAVNLSGIHVDDVRRGMVVATPGAITPAHAVDVRLRATRILTHPLAHDAGITFLSATSESEAKLRLLDRDELRPGEECWAQVVLQDPVAVVAADHCIVRTPNETVGGGLIVAVNPRRHRRNHPATLDALARLLEGTPADRLIDLLLSGPIPSQDVPARLGVEPADATAAIAEASGDGRIHDASGVLYATAWLDATLARLEAVLSSFLGANALRSGVPREHVRSALRLDPAVFTTLVAHGVARGTIEERSAYLASAGYRVTVSSAQQHAIDGFLAALRDGRFSPPTEGLPPPELLTYLVEQGLVEDTGAGVVFDRKVFDEMVQRVREHIEANGSITLAGVRDLFGTSRKYAQAFLERLDALRITRRVGDERVLR